MTANPLTHQGFLTTEEVLNDANGDLPNPLRGTPVRETAPWAPAA